MKYRLNNIEIFNTYWPHPVTKCYDKLYIYKYSIWKLDQIVMVMHAERKKYTKLSGTEVKLLE